MNQTINKQYCQSCGMPLRFDVEEYLGTNADQSRSDEYCYYCLKDGEYTVDIPMEQMVDIWVKYTDKYNEYSDTNYTPQDLHTLLHKRLPTLKRWKQKQVTKDIHHEAVDKVKKYIDQNLDKAIDVEELSRMVNLSFFHFRRIFKDVTGENIGSYIQRIRLEYVAHKLISTHWTAHEILERTGYQTSSSLAKAFRKHFGISMSDYRNRYTLVNPTDGLDSPHLILQPEIKRLKEQLAVCYPVDRKDHNGRRYVNVWNKLIHYKHKYIKPQDAGWFVSMSMDNPLITSEKQCRFYLGILVSREHQLKTKLSIHNIPSGLYAIFRHIGNYDSLPEVYQFIYEVWLPKSNYSQSSSLSFEVYRNSPRDTDITELITEVYIPIEKTIK